MKRTLTVAAVLSVFAALGCASTATLAPASPSTKGADTATIDTQDVKAESDDVDEASKKEAAQTSADEGGAAASAKSSPETATWAAGDFVVYRFSGTFHKTPVTLTQKVIARQGELFTLEVAYDDGVTKETIRAKMKGESPARSEVLSVSRLVRGAEKAAEVGLYDAIFARVALVTDQNEATLANESLKVDVAGSGKLACERATYRVKVGKDTATMRTLGSPAFVWGDVAADITTANGKLIYKAEVVDSGHEAAKPAVIASTDDEY